jgi:hypothetical protein
MSCIGHRWMPLGVGILDRALQRGNIHIRLPSANWLPIW